jgi:glutathionylspermidine synthase
VQRQEIAPRADWQRRVEAAGLAYHSDGQVPGPGGGLYWHEGAYWSLTEAEVDALDDATAELHARCLDAVDHLVNREPEALTRDFALPDWFAAALSDSWRRGDPALMGRMDLAFDDRTGAVALLEYNADTPTLAIETAVAQWYWLQDAFPDADQFNSLHEKLLSRFQWLAPLMGGQPMHFAAYPDLPEEWLHSTYYRDLAEQAGIRAIPIALESVGFDGQTFRGEQGEEIRFLHKLYPWEWAIRDEFGRQLAGDKTGVLEPPWKALLSDKAILPVLHKLFPDHPHILPAFLGRQGDRPGAWVEKPCLGREGANIRLSRDGFTEEQTDGDYGGADARFITQARAVLPERDGWHAVIGSWVVGEETGGIIFREARERVMRETSRVVPHLFR